MKVTLGEIYDSFAVLAELYSLKLKINLKYKLGRIFTESEAEVKRFHELHLEMIKNFGGVEIEVGKEKAWKVPEENLKDFEPEFNQLRETVVEIWGKPIGLAEFENSETIFCPTCKAVVEKTAPEIKGDITKLFWLIHPDEEVVAPPVNECHKLSKF